MRILRVSRFVTVIIPIHHVLETSTQIPITDKRFLAGNKKQTGLIRTIPVNHLVGLVVKLIEKNLTEYN